MAILVTDEYRGRFEAAPRGTLVAGVLVNFAGVIVGGVTQPVMGIVVDAVPTDTPPTMSRIAGKGCIIEDTVFDGVAIGTVIFSDGDGTYSSVDPGGAAGANKVVMGIVRRIDTRAADTGCEIELTLEVIQDGVA